MTKVMLLTISRFTLQHAIGEIAQLSILPNTGGAFLSLAARRCAAGLFFGSAAGWMAFGRPTGRTTKPLCEALRSQRDFTAMNEGCRQIEGR